jgi:hypothetical protein
LRDEKPTSLASLVKGLIEVYDDHNVPN